MNGEGDRGTISELQSKALWTRGDIQDAMELYNEGMRASADGLTYHPEFAYQEFYFGEWSDSEKECARVIARYLAASKEQRHAWLSAVSRG